MALISCNRLWCWNVQYDKQWDSDAGFCFYDFNAPDSTSAPPLPAPACAPTYCPALDINLLCCCWPCPAGIPAELQHVFDLVVIDPPFITREVWEKYAISARLLARPGDSKYLCSTIAENAEMMAEILGVVPQVRQGTMGNLELKWKEIGEGRGGYGADCVTLDAPRLVCP